MCKFPKKTEHTASTQGNKAMEKNVRNGMTKIGHRYVGLVRDEFTQVHIANLIRSIKINN